jgi:integration host factor subunit beta
MRLPPDSHVPEDARLIRGLKKRHRIRSRGATALRIESFVTRSDIIAAMVRRHSHFNHDDISACVRLVLDAIKSALAEGRRVELRNFGIFDLKLAASRIRRNPRSGETFYSSPKRVITFRAGRRVRLTLRDRVEAPEEHGTIGFSAVSVQASQPSPGSVGIVQVAPPTPPVRGDEATGGVDENLFSQRKCA